MKNTFVVTFHKKNQKKISRKKNQKIYIWIGIFYLLKEGYLEPKVKKKFWSSVKGQHSKRFI